jgi:hypothetical protein
MRWVKNFETLPEHLNGETEEHYGKKKKTSVKITDYLTYIRTKYLQNTSLTQITPSQDVISFHFKNKNVDGALSCCSLHRRNTANSLRVSQDTFNPLNAELNPICHLLALLGAHHILHISKIRVKGNGIQNWFSPR